METYESIKQQAFFGNIYCNCVFKWKNNIKKLGFKWDPKVKHWFIPEKRFTQAIHDATKEIRFVNDTTAGQSKYYYVNYLRKKDIEEEFADLKLSPTSTSTSTSTSTKYLF